MNDMTPIHGCSGCATTGGRMACPHHGPQARSTVVPTNITVYVCAGSPTHDYAVGPFHAICNRCGNVVVLGVETGGPSDA